MKPSLPVELQADLETFATQCGQKHAAAFEADPHLKELCARALRTRLPPHTPTGRPGLVSVTRALRLLKQYRKTHPADSAAERWARIYSQVIPMHATLSRDRRIHEQHLLRDRVRSRRNMQRRRKNKGSVVPPETTQA